jgi:hypothetical protein
MAGRKTLCGAFSNPAARSRETTSTVGRCTLSAQAAVTVIASISIMRSGDTRLFASTSLLAGYPRLKDSARTFWIACRWLT